MEAYYPMLKDAAGMFVFLGIELSLLFFVISAAVGLVQQYIPESKIQAVLSGKGGRGYAIAALLGALTPFCSCSTIPMLRGLLKAKAGFGPTLTFLFTSPLLNPIIIALFIATFGIKVTVTYALIALAVSVFAGIVLQRMGYERYIMPENEVPTNSCGCGVTQATEPSSSCCSAVKEPEPVSCCASVQSTPVLSCCTPAPVACCDTIVGRSPKFATKLKIAMAGAWVQLKNVAPYLLIGVLLGAVVYGFVPSDFIAKYAGADNIFAVPIAAVIGIPLYVRMEALIPISAALVGKGMGLGAVMALIIGGSGASITELILLKSLFRLPMMIAFLFVILGMAVFAGYFFQFVF